jgi:hypothetical protein
MDEIDTELLRLLYTRIGMEMEDASIIALDLGGPRGRFKQEKVPKLRQSVAIISKLADAAQSIAE